MVDLRGSMKSPGWDTLCPLACSIQRWCPGGPQGGQARAGDKSGLAVRKSRVCRCCSDSTGWALRGLPSAWTGLFPVPEFSGQPRHTGRGRWGGILIPSTPSSLRVKPGLPSPARTVPSCHPLPQIGAQGVARCPGISYQGWEALPGGKTSQIAGAWGGWEVDLVLHGPSLTVSDVLHFPGAPNVLSCP